MGRNNSWIQELTKDVRFFSKWLGWSHSPLNWSRHLFQGCQSTSIIDCIGSDRKKWGFGQVPFRTVWAEGKWWDSTDFCKEYVLTACQTYFVHNGSNKVKKKTLSKTFLVGWHQFCHHRNWQKRTNGIYQKMNALIKVCQSHPNLFRKSPVFKWSDRHLCPDCSVLRMMGEADTRDEGLTLLLRPLSGLELHLNTLISILCEEISWVRLVICVYLSILWRPCGFLFCFIWFCFAKASRHRKRVVSSLGL